MILKVYSFLQKHFYKLKKKSSLIQKAIMRD